MQINALHMVRSSGFITYYLFNVIRQSLVSTPIYSPCPLAFRYSPIHHSLTPPPFMTAPLRATITAHWGLQVATRPSWPLSFRPDCRSEGAGGLLELPLLITVHPVYLIVTMGSPVFSRGLLAGEEERTGVRTSKQWLSEVVTGCPDVTGSEWKG